MHSSVYTNPDCIKFVKQMKKAGLKPYHYHGRNFYHGPAVNVNSLQEALSETRVKCQYDQMGRGYVVYPIASDNMAQYEGEKAAKKAYEKSLKN